MILAYLAAAFLGSAPGDVGVTPTITSVGGGPVFAAGTTNLNYPMTNLGLVFSSNVYSGATVGDQLAFTIPTNYTYLGFDNFTPEVAGFSGNRTIWATNGVFRYRIQMRNARGQDVASAGAVRIGTLTGAQTTWGFSNFVSGSLGGYAYASLLTATNAKDNLIWTSRSGMGWVWNTNSFIFGKHGYTGLSHSAQLPSTGNSSFPWAWTAITRRHAYSAGHVFGGNTTNGYIYFVGSDGATNAMFVTSCRQSYGTNGDYCIVFFSSDLPAAVQPVMVLNGTNYLNKVPLGRQGFFYWPDPYFETCQHGKVGSQGMWGFFDDHYVHAGGDSGNPLLFLAGTNLVNFGGTSGTLLNGTFESDMNALTTAAGLNTNDYQPTYFDASGYPNY